MVTVKLHTEDGITIEFDAVPGEYEQALYTTLRAIRTTSPAPVLADPGPSAADLTAIVERLSPETVDYLRLLVENPGGLTDDEITKELGLDTRQKLAGMNGAVTKVADNYGVSGRDIISRVVNRGPEGSRTYHYKVPDRIRPMLMDALPEEAESAVGMTPSGPDDAGFDV